MRGLLGAPLFLIFCALIVFWAVGAYVLTVSQFIAIENGFLISGGCGVAVTYFPAAWTALTSGRPTRSDILAFGIWLAWVSIPAQRMLSFVGRMLHKDMSFYSTHLNTLILALMTYAVLCHLMAPEALEGRIPARAYTRLGYFVFFAVLIIMMTVVFTGF